jgi:hypothetical protein
MRSFADTSPSGDEHAPRSYASIASRDRARINIGKPESLEEQQEIESFSVAEVDRSKVEIEGSY